METLKDVYTVMPLEKELDTRLVEEKRQVKRKDRTGEVLRRTNKKKEEGKKIRKGKAG